MVKISFRSQEAISLAKELLPNYPRFAQAEELIREMRLRHVDLACRDEAVSETWEVEAEARALAEQMDPGHSARRIQFAYLLSATDEVVDGCQPICHRPNPITRKTI